MPQPHLGLLQPQLVLPQLLHLGLAHLLQPQLDLWLQLPHLLSHLLHLLLAAYDDAHPPYGKAATHAEILAHVLEHRGMKQADLIPVVGSSAYVSQILSGKRGISRKMAVRLGEFFGLEPSVFLN